MALQHSQLGLSLRTTAVGFGVCEKTVRRWLARAQQAGFPQRLHDHSSRPLRQPRKTSSPLEAQILALRRQRRSYAQIMMVLPVSKATLSRVLRRHHLNRLSALKPPKPPPLRYERATPGDLLHLDIKKLGPASFAQASAPPAIAPSATQAPASKVSTSPSMTTLALPSLVCSQTKGLLASSTLCTKPSTFYSAHGIKIQQVMTDRGSTYRSKLFAASCHQLGLTHLFTKPYRPQTNGKAERFIQTITREWAYARSYNSSNHRATFLPLYLHDYNFHRPHSALQSLPPSSRLPKTADNVSRHNS